MQTPHSRRDILKGGLAVAGLGMLGLPEWALPVLAQGEVLVPFTDIPDNVRWEVPPDRRTLDIRTIDGPFTPKDKFATTQHYGHPDVDPATYKLKVTGLVNQTKSFSLDDLKKMGGKELVAGFECSGNRGPLQSLCGNGRWTGLPLKTVLDAAGVKASAKEFVFFGADHGQEEIEWRTQKFTARTEFRPQPAPREGVVARVVPGLRAERRPADEASRRAASAGRARLLRRLQCQMALAHPPAGGCSTSAGSRRAGTARCAAK